MSSAAILIDALRVTYDTFREFRTTFTCAVWMWNESLTEGELVHCRERRLQFFFFAFLLIGVKFFSLRVDPISEGLHHPGKQTRSRKVLTICKRANSSC